MAGFEPGVKFVRSTNFTTATAHYQIGKTSRNGRRRFP